MFLVNDAAVINPFNSQYFFWLDAGITHTVHPGYFTHDKVQENLPRYVEEDGRKWVCLSYPYETQGEVHGFPAKELAKYCGVEATKYVCRGGFFGGHKETVHHFNALYYAYLQRTLQNHLMGADECVFTILAHQHANEVRRFELLPEHGGLTGPFFEFLKSVKDKPVPVGAQKALGMTKQIMYILSFNFPLQLQRLMDAFAACDTDFLTRPRIVLINNSTKRETDAEYDAIAAKYRMEEIHKDNIGICGGRQFAAEHFAQSGADYMIFFEDDMTPWPAGHQGHCALGFRQFIGGLYEKSLAIEHKHQYDYLALAFSEFYGERDMQWAWTNIPPEVRARLFPGYPPPKVETLREDAPRTQFTYIRKLGDLAYIEGSCHYDNWPLWFNQEGNRKVFLETKWAHPQEQTWMSYVCQKQAEGYIKPAVLLLSPINHTRKADCSYTKEERREN